MMPWMIFATVKSDAFEFDLSGFQDQSRSLWEDPPSGGGVFHIKGYSHRPLDTTVLWSFTLRDGTLIHWGSQCFSGTADIKLEQQVASHLLLCLITVLSLDVLSAQWAQSEKRPAWFLSTYRHSEAERGWVIAAGLYHQSLHRGLFISVKVKCQWHCCPRCTSHAGRPLCLLTFTSLEITVRPYQTQTIHPPPHWYLSVTESRGYHLLV